MSLLGILSLSGMLMKNEIVLLDQTNSERAIGIPLMQVVIDSAASHVRPVSLALLALYWERHPFSGMRFPSPREIFDHCPIT